MAYARFSTDDYTSDVYVYHCDEGFVTHVARGRYLPTEPMPAPLAIPAPGSDPVDMEAFALLVLERAAQVSAILDGALLHDIDGPHDGETFVDQTPAQCAQRLLMLREAGYVVPQQAVDALLEEQSA